MNLMIYLAVGVLSFLVLHSNRVFCSGECTCHPVEKSFDTKIQDKVQRTCRKCYVFTYDFTLDQNWTYYLCVNSSKASNHHSPLLVTVREFLSVMSFQVPQTFNDRGNSSFTNVCHTLCPLVNYFDEKLNAGKQSIFVEIATQEETMIEFEVTMSKIDNFIIGTEEAHNVTITPSQPQIMQYNLEDGVGPVRIEATSPDVSCMILAVQNIKCPFSDFENTVEQQSGFYQTIMTKSAIAITKNFPRKQMYIVLLMKTSNDDCVEPSEKEVIPAHLLSKEVTVKIIPALTDDEYYYAVFGAAGVYVTFYFISFCICAIIRIRAFSEKKHLDVETPGPQNPGKSGTQNPGAGNRLLQNAGGQEMQDLTDLDTKTILYVADLARTRETDLSKRSKVYTWNLLAIAIFYAIPVFQLVYINQGIVNLTGNQDICYYNFLCSLQVWIFSDFNHIYSNIGYVLLGILFNILVWRRKSFCHETSTGRRITGPQKGKGIPPYHFELLYSMGLALILEGFLSAFYHVCPNQANFQFDTTFMYVICVVCMLKLYHARRPDITPESHTTWMILAVVIFCTVGGILNRHVAYWIFFVLHVILNAVVSVKIYYIDSVKFNTGIFKRVRQKLQEARAANSYYPAHQSRFYLLLITTLVNLGLDMYGLIDQPVDFATFVLTVLLVNLLMHLIFYALMKLTYGERIGCIPILYFAVAIVCWAVAYALFQTHNTSWEDTPAESREKNRHCFILNFFDQHDAWHFMSSIALFFSFMVLLTVDDDLDNTPRTHMMVF